MTTNIASNLAAKNPLFPYDETDIFYPESDGEPMAETDKHRDLIVDLISALKNYFLERADVYVTGNIMFYYMEGAPEEVISPDVMVCFGVEKKERRIYQTWNENDVVPSVIFEIASRKTWGRDRDEKRRLYEILGVQEYYIFNPEYPKRSPALLAEKLKNGRFEVVNTENSRVFSEVLKLEIVDTGNSLRFFNVQTNCFLLSIEETARERESLESENTELKSELERLKKLLNEK